MYMHSEKAFYLSGFFGPVYRGIRALARRMLSFRQSENFVLFRVR